MHVVRNACTRTAFQVESLDDIGTVFQKLLALFCIHLDMYSYRISVVANIFILDWSRLL